MNVGDILSGVTAAIADLVLISVVFVIKVVLIRLLIKAIAVHSAASRFMRVTLASIPTATAYGIAAYFAQAPAGAIAITTGVLIGLLCFRLICWIKWLQTLVSNSAEPPNGVSSTNRNRKNPSPEPTSSIIAAARG